jgi:hypothetical protein
MKHRSVSEVGYQRSKILRSETYAHVELETACQSQLLNLSVSLQLFLTSNFPYPATRLVQPRLGSTQVAA